MKASNKQILPAQLLLASAFLALVACGGGGGGGEEESSSSSAPSSSSALSDREDIVYSDTILSDTLHTRILSDSANGSWTYYLGEYPAGTQLTVWAATQNLTGARLRIRAEGSVKALLPSDANPDGQFQDYMVPASDTLSSLVGNDFYTLAAGFYALEIEGTPNADTALLRLHVTPRRARFAYTGTGDSLQLIAGDTLRGFFQLSKGGGSVHVRFRSPEGFNLNLSTNGTLIDTTWLTDSSTAATLATGQNALRLQLLPQTPSAWDVHIQSATPTYLDGPYAFFELVLNSLQMLQGEYFSKPDSIVKAGDTLKVLRPRNDAALYDMRHDQYVYLGTYQSGDSLVVIHQNYGFTSLRAPGMLILDANQEKVDTLTNARGWGFKVTTAGPYYLHYWRTDGYAEDPALTLSLTTVVQHIGSLTDWTLQNSTGSDMGFKDLAVGDTLFMAKSLLWVPSPISASTAVQWFIPCADYNIIRDDRNLTTCTGERFKVNTPWIRAIGSGSGRLISQSVADPTQSDTLIVVVP